MLEKSLMSCIGAEFYAAKKLALFFYSLNKH